MKLLPPITLCLLFLALPVHAQEASAPAGSEETVIFGFHPEDGAQWRKTMVDRSERDFGGLAPAVTQITEQELLVEYARAEEAWMVTQRATSARMMDASGEIQNPILDLAIGVPITLTVNPLGQAVAAAGFDAFWDKLENNLDAEVYSRLVQSTSPEQMADNEIQIWNRFYSELLGHRIRPGENWRVLDGTDVGSGGRARLLGTIRFDGWTELDGIRGFKVTHEFDTTGEKMQALGDDHTRSISRVGDEQFETSNIVIEGTWVVVIQPETGQLLYSVRDQTTRLPIGDPVDGLEAVFTKHHTYRWTRVES